MFTLDHIPNPQRAKLHVFTNGDRVGERYYPWPKPPNCKWVYMFGVGGGAGGAKVGAGTTAGAGGGTGAVMSALYPAWVLPDMLFVVPGTGGPGATTAGNNTGGASSRVLGTPNTGTASYVYLVANRHPGVTGQSAGTAAAATSATTLNLSGAAWWYSIAGTNGNVGANAADTVGGGVTPGGNGIMFCGGGGGGTGTGAGGLINARGYWLARSGGAGTTGGNGGPGQNIGVRLDAMLSRGEPLIFGGGTGGGGASSGTAGNGGAGALGCGGGGGGGGAGITTGNGGDGGDGFVLIWTW